VQADPIKPTLKAPATKRLKLQYDGPLYNFAFNFNLRRYNVAPLAVVESHVGRGLHSSTFRLNVSAFCGIGVHLGIFYAVLRRCYGILGGI